MGNMVDYLENGNMDNLILNQLSDRLYEIGKFFGFSKPIIRSDRYTSEIYIINKHALQIEIDWSENNLFMYVVYLKSGKLPDKNVIYSYADGHWCRKYLEEVYDSKRPCVKDHRVRYSLEYLIDCFEFYKKLIDSNPVILTEFYKSISE